MTRCSATRPRPGRSGGAALSDERVEVVGHEFRFRPSYGDDLGEEVARTICVEVHPDPLDEHKHRFARDPELL